MSKNETVMANWHVIIGLHDTISLHFMTAGHTRCLVDGYFGRTDLKYCASDTFTLDQLPNNVVYQTAVWIVAEVVNEERVPWYDWDSYLLQRFRDLASERDQKIGPFCC